MGVQFMCCHPCITMIVVSFMERIPSCSKAMLSRFCLLFQHLHVIRSQCGYLLACEFRCSTDCKKRYQGRQSLSFFCMLLFILALHSLTLDCDVGEELRITYIDASMPRSSRQQLLQKSYHFRCNCARCRDDDDDDGDG